MARATEADLLCAAAHATWQHGDRDSALTLLRAAAHAAVTSPPGPDRLDAAFAVCAEALDAGMWPIASAACESVLTDVPNVIAQDPRRAAVFLDVAGACAAQSGAHSLAMPLLIRADSLVDALPDSFTLRETTRHHEYLAQSFRALREWTAALVQSDRAIHLDSLAVARTHAYHDSLWLMARHTNRALLFLDIGVPERAQEELDAARAFAPFIPTLEPDNAQLMAAEGLVALQRGASSRALALLAPLAAVRRGRSKPYHPLTLEAWADMAEARAQLPDRQQIATARRAIGAILHSAVRYPVRSALEARWRSVEALCDWRLGDTLRAVVSSARAESLAWQVAEDAAPMRDPAARAYAFGEYVRVLGLRLAVVVARADAEAVRECFAHLASARGLLDLGASDGDTAARRAIDRVRLRLVTARSDGERAAIARELASREAAVQLVESAVPHATWSPDVPRDPAQFVAACARRLPRGAVLYVPVRVPETRSGGAAHYFAFTLTAHGSLRVRDLGAAAPLDAAASTWHDFVSQRSRSTMPRPDIMRAGVLLRRRLWDAPLAGTHPRDVVIVPDGVWRLVSPMTLPEDARGTRVLLDRETIVEFAPSEVTLLHSSPSRAAGVPVAIGDLDYGPLRGAPGPVQVAGLRAASDLRFAPLACAASELDAVTAPGWRTLRGAAATEMAVRAASRDASVLHFATHGFYWAPDAAAGASLRRALLSSSLVPWTAAGIALAGANDRAGRDASRDGILELSEIASLQLRGVPLVFLAACSTAVASPSAATSLHGLRSAFCSAGARSVVAALWNVPDCENADLVRAFYDGWRRGARPARALRDAQRAARARERLRAPNAAGGWTSPAVWGVYVVEGRP